MYKLAFTLKQHTPLIHFQHDQEGATLRATEVKPKLDRFIYQKWIQAENGNREAVFRRYGHLTVGFSESKMQAEIKKYDLLNEDKKREYLKDFKWALDYKMRIENKGARDENQKFTLYEDQQEQDLSIKYKMKGNYPMVLANMGGQPSISDLKDSIVYEKLHCTIISFNLSLKSHIEDLIVEFFAR